MSTTLRLIRVLSDGRPGHANQSQGLAEALQRRTGAHIETVVIDPATGLWSRVLAARACADGAEVPGLVIAAGHRTHVPLLAASRRFGASSVVIMRPTLPAWCFDLCLVPRHDLRRLPGEHARMVATRGALNRLPETPPVKEARGLILLGGPSKHHGWDGRPVLDALAQIAGRSPELLWTVANSRRTPPRVLEQVGEMGLPVTVVPHEQTVPGWLPAQLMAAQEVWVTEDSTSMVFEAITAGARVGLLPTPLKRAETRVARAIADVVADGYAVRYADWVAGGVLRPAAGRLHEAARCAGLVLERFFKAD